MRNFTWAAGFAAVWLFVFACSDGTSTSTTGAGGSTGSTGSGGDAAAAIVDMFCNTLARPYCEADWACCVLPSLAADRGVDKCVQVVLSGTPAICSHEWETRALLEGYLRAGTSVFDQAQFDTCLARLKSITAEGAACTEAPWNVLATTCISAFRGQGAPGDACSAGHVYDGIVENGVVPCKDGRCENGVCVPFLKLGDTCDLSIDQREPYGNFASVLCNFVKHERCRGVADAGGAGGGGGAGSAGSIGTCRPEGEIGDGCDPYNRFECKSHTCDQTTGKCALPFRSSLDVCPNE